MLYRLLQEPPSYSGFLHDSWPRFSSAATSVSYRLPYTPRPWLIEYSRSLPSNYRSNTACVPTNWWSRLQKEDRQRKVDCSDWSYCTTLLLRSIQCHRHPFPLHLQAVCFFFRAAHPSWRLSVIRPEEQQICDDGRVWGQSKEELGCIVACNECCIDLHFGACRSKYSSHFADVARSGQSIVSLSLLREETAIFTNTNGRKHNLPKNYQLNDEIWLLLHVVFTSLTRSWFFLSFRCMLGGIQESTYLISASVCQSNLAEYSSNFIKLVVISG